MEMFQNYWRAILGFMLFSLIIFVTCERAPNYSFLHEATTAPLRSYYDYIIVGGGTAGCPLAATLSQNASVLLLERGGSPYDNVNITSIDAFGNALLDTSSSSPSQLFISEDGVANNRANVLGGGTCINAGFYTRGDEEFLKEAGLESDEKLLNESYQWVENKLVFKPSLKKWQSAARDGLLEVGLLPDNGFTYDHIYGTKVSGVIYDKDGNRHTAANLLEYANPFGIKVLLHASVLKILFRTKGESGQLVASGVIFKDALGKKHTAFLKKGSKNEVILSAGAIGSPQLLMLSGVGPANHLKSHNIKVVLDQPLVGKGMGDTPLNFIYVPSRIPVDISLPQIVGITDFGSYIEALSGKSLELPNGQNEGELKGGYIGEKTMGPLSRGDLKLKSKNIDDNPSVTFNYFDNPKDLERCVNGMKIVGKVIESKSMSKFKYDEHSLSFLVNLTTSLKLNLRPKHENASTSLEQFCKDTIHTIWHYHGGCQIGKVVDKNYKIIGVDSIRIVDGSIFLSSPGTNPQATLMMLGRYMGIKILEERFEDIVQKIESDRQNNIFAA